MPSEPHPTGQPNRAAHARAGVRSDGGERADRAQQFIPFAALRGYYDLVRAQERRVEPRHELTEEEALELSRVMARVSKGSMVEAVHYDGDAYETTTGLVSAVDTAFRTLTVVKRRIAFDDLRSLRIVG